VINGNIDGTDRGGWTLKGFTVSSAYVEAERSSNARITRNILIGGADHGDIYGPTAVINYRASGLTIDHNELHGQATGLNSGYGARDVLITQNAFFDVRQGVNVNVDDYSTSGLTITKNYFSGNTRMPIEICCFGGTTNTVVDGNWVENLGWNGVIEGDAGVAYSIVSNNTNATVTNNVALWDGITSYGCIDAGHCSIGIELLGSGIVSHNILSHFALGPVIVYGGGGIDDGTSITTADNLPPKPQTGPNAP
jgi:hypothetical protein